MLNTEDLQEGGVPFLLAIQKKAKYIQKRCGMKTLKDAGKDILLAGLGTLDEQNDEIKDLLRRGSEAFGMTMVDNEELCYNGNRERIMAERAAKEGDYVYSLGNGKSVSFEAVKDGDGKVVERKFGFEKQPADPKTVEINLEQSEDGKKAVKVDIKNE